MIGTTNRNQFLVDSTGNRRFVPLDWRWLPDSLEEAVLKNVTVLWAAAVHAYRRRRWIRVQQW